MRRMAALLIGALAAGCADDAHVPPAAEAQQQPTQERTAREPAQQPAATEPPPAAWPSAALLARAARLGDPATRDQAIAELEALPLAERVELLRAGLHLPDGPAALECARRVENTWLDDAEMSRVTLLLAAAIASGDKTKGSNNYWNTLEFISSDDLTVILREHLPDDAKLLKSRTASLFHKVARADHLPLMAELQTTLEPATFDELTEIVWLVVRNTDKHRAEVAQLALGPDAVAALPADDGEGLPPRLVANLEVAIDAKFLNGEYGWWAQRWLRDETPGERDIPLLLRLALTDLAPDATLALWKVPGPESVRALRTIHEEGDPDDELTALGGLALHGDEAALAELMATRIDDEEALAVLLAVAPQRAIERVAAVLLDPKATFDVFYEALSAVSDAAGEMRYERGIEWDLAAFEGFERRALATPLGAARTLAIANSVPTCWTKTMARGCLAQLSDAPPAAWLDDGIDSSELALLEVATPDAFRARLRTWAALPAGPASEFAIDLLARLGDPQAEALLAAWVERRLAAGESPFAEETRLGLSPGPQLRAVLTRVATGEFAVADEEVEAALAALAQMDGVPPSVWDSYPDDEERAAAIRVEVSRLILERKPVDALLHLMAESPGWCEGAGEVRDDRVVARLRELRDQRELGAYVHITAELAIAGDEDARAEILRGGGRGRYRWGDLLWTRALTIGWDAETIPVWLDGMESSCCWLPVANACLRDFMGRDASSHHGYLTTGRREAERWLADHPGPYVYSRLAEFHVPEPR